MNPSLEKSFEHSTTEISFREIFEFAPIGVIIFQRDWKIKFVNKNFFRFNGVVVNTPQDIIGRSIFENRLFHEADIRDELNLLKKGETFEKEIVASHTLTGGKVSILLKGAPIIFNDEFTGGVLILEDIKIDAVKTHGSLIHSGDFQSFLGSFSDFFIVVDKEGIARVLPSTGIELFDFLFEPETGKSIFPSKKISSILFKKLLENVFANNKVISTQIPFIRNQREIPARVTLIPFSEGGLEVDWVILLVKDFSRESEHIGLSEEEITELTKYQQITATVIDGLIGTNKNGKITFWNESAYKLIGLTRSEVYGKFLGKIFSNIDEKYFEELKEHVRINKEWRGQFHIGEDESIADYYDVKIGIVGDGDDETVFLLCTPVTERVNQEKKIKISEERFRNIVTNSHEFICTLDLRGRITYANPHFLEVFQYSEKEIVNLEFPELIDSYYPIKEPFDFKSIAEKQLHTFELPLLTKAGQRIHVLSSFSSVEDINGSVQYYNVILTDITLKKESEKDLMLIRSVFEASQNGIVLLNKKRIALVNDSFVEIFGFRSASEILGMNPLDFIDAKDKERVAFLIEMAEDGKETPSRFYFTGRKKNFSSFEVENSVSTYEIENEKFAVWILRDVTEEKKAQNALTISEERYRSITENISESIWTAERQDGKLKAVFYTPAIKKITTYEDHEFIEDPTLWKKIIHPDDVDEVVDKLHKFYADPARYSDAIECRIIDTLGNIIWIEDRITLVRDSKGEIQKIFGIVSDISLSKRAEEELKKSAQNLKELNETKDRFISIISHDLRTPFSSILGFTDLLLNDKELDEEGKTQYIQYIQESSKSMLSLVNSLLDWTRLQTGSVKFEPERINAKELIEKSIQILSGAALQKKINLIPEMQKDFYVHADSGLLLQVFNNLISNAIKFTKPGGSIRVNAQANIEKKQVEFYVKDDGVGISKEDIPKLFKVDSKYTTSGTAGEKGSGLGLSLVHDIIQKHGGEIWVESETGKGTEFIFSIPVASANILLVDDLKTDRLLYSKLIRSLIPSYKILEAENGKQALDVIKHSSPALVITDHKMPVMSGYDLVKQLNMTELKYKPPVIVLSSDLNKSIEAEYKDLGVEFIFEKPVNLANFKNAIERSLRKAIFN
ncbi:MAG: PAS domain S-box protein [Ignavibacteriales bacterium]|nr:PAS domain S-box protein [Ignavibacteriales bacterium]